MRRSAVMAVLLALSAPAVRSAPPTDEAIRLRNDGIAQLENEQPAEAEEIFRRLSEMRPTDPLGPANLAIAHLRQQEFDEARGAIGAALERSPGDPRLLTIQAEIEQWSGDPQAALTIYRQAAQRAPDDPETQFALYRVASSLGGTEAEAAAAEALERLVRLRPENLVVLLQRGLEARDRSDRATASSAFLRIRDLIWQAPPAAAQLVQQVLAALEANDLEAARVPALRLGNLLKVTAMHRESQRELATGIQGIPLTGLRDEPPAAAWGDPVPVRFRGRRLSDRPTVGRGLAVGDFDGDLVPDLARLVTGAGGETELELRLSLQGLDVAASHPAAGLESLIALDLDNDGRLDLFGFGPGAARVWRGGENGLSEATADFGLAGASGTAAAAIDFDIEGDLDLAVGRAAGGRPMELWLNALDGPLEAVGGRTLPALDWGPVRDLVATDLDRDGDLDLLVAHDGGLAWLDNLRQGELIDRTAAAGLTGVGGTRAVVPADLDNDGLPDLIVAAGRELAFFRNLGGRFERFRPGDMPLTGVELEAIEAFDADNDGRLDWAVAGPRALAVSVQRGAGVGFLNLDGAPAGASALAAADFDGDGDLDLAAAGAGGLHLLDNEGGNANRWLAVRLRGLDKGNSKNNLFGLGSTLELRAGAAYQFREVHGDVTHFGLGRVATPDLLRVVWTNGVPQNRLAPKVAQTIVEEQVLKGSCPFLYAWDGEQVRFVTDLLWGAPAGLPLAPGVWAGADPDELVVVEGARPRDGRYDLRITEELWEAAFFDAATLWIVDHPGDLETATALRVLPGRATPQEVLATRDLRPVAAAWDAAGADVTDRVARRDEIYADGWRRSAYQGVAADTWTFTFDLGAAPGRPIRLHLDGWIFPTDASLNLALAQRGYRPVGPRLEVETGGGWEVLIAETGFPAGKTKTLVLDTPRLPKGARRLRLVSSLWLSWDRIAWSVSPADGEPRIVAKLPPASAELGFRGFSALVRRAPNAPHTYDYERVSTESPWLPFPGRYTRYGDVAELLAEADDRSVILGPGDEMQLSFDASHLPPPPAGWTRTVFLESHGWDKDADRNTWQAHQVEPLPFRAMSGYPGRPGESFPDTPFHREYRERWLTREVAGPGR